MVNDLFGSPIEAARIEISRTGATSRAATTNAGGEFTIGTLPAGTWQLKVTKSGFRDQTAELKVDAMAPVRWT